VGGYLRFVRLPPNCSAVDLLVQGKSKLLHDSGQLGKAVADLGRLALEVRHGVHDSIAWQDGYPSLKSYDVK
jgi:hypothetical protein